MSGHSGILFGIYNMLYYFEGKTNIKSQNRLCEHLISIFNYCISLINIFIFNI